METTNINPYKEYQNNYTKTRRNTEERKKYMTEYRSKPENLLRKRKNAQKPENKLKVKNNRDTPEFKQAYRNKIYFQKYGITLDNYNIMLEEQNFCCKICKRNESEFIKKLAVDHCHNTGKVRGLLCNDCNLGIAYLKDSTINLENAIEYLKE